MNEKHLALTFENWQDLDDEICQKQNDYFQFNSLERFVQYDKQRQALGLTSASRATI